MTRDKIDQLAKLANIDLENHVSLSREPVWIATPDELERFAALLLEEAARCCDEVSQELGGVAEGPFVTDFGKHTHNAMAAGAQNAAAAVRAMKPEVK
jgi:hypothetical protein